VGTAVGVVTQRRASETQLAWRRCGLFALLTAMSTHVAAFGLRRPAVWVVSQHVGAARGICRAA
jgi:hypothetical protein